MSEYVVTTAQHASYIAGYLIMCFISPDYRDGSQRKRFSIKKFAEKYNLEGPIAGNFMVAEYDDNVPAYHKRLNL